VVVPHRLAPKGAALPAFNLINAPDEEAHLQYLQTINRAGRLPAAEDTYEYHQPPLYYILASAGFQAGVPAARLFTLAAGLAGVLVIFAAARLLLPQEPGTAVLAAGIAALLPMRQAVYSSVGNDALTELLFSLFLLSVLSVMRNGLTAARAAQTGAAVGLALATKGSAVLLLPLSAAALWVWRLGGEDSRALLRFGAVMVSVAALLSAPVYVRNLRLFGALTPFKAFAREFEGTAKASDWIGKQPLSVDPVSGSLQPGPVMDRLGYTLLVANWTCRTFLGSWTPPGKPAEQGIPRFLPPPFYLLGALPLLFVPIGLWRLHMRRKEMFIPLQVHFIRLMFATLLLVALSFAAFTFHWFQAQGRYLYPAMLPMAVLGAMGFRAAVPPSRRAAATGAFLGLLALLDFLFLFTAILPAYQP
jgi:hypothetical protein